MTMTSGAMGLTLRIHRFLPQTEAEGPGVRASLWVQGCQAHCSGCFNKDAQYLGGGTIVSIGSLYERISSQGGIEGVTFVGGEPFLQADSLAELGRLCQGIGLSVVTFTGLEYRYLLEQDRPDWARLLSVTDLLLAGPYVESRQDFSRPWVGSANQSFVFLTDRYRHLRDSLFEIPNRLEIRLEASGRLGLNGMASQEEIARLQEELETLGLRLRR